jgi:hypothetical protein
VKEFSCGAVVPDCSATYEERYAGLVDQVAARVADPAPADADPGHHDAARAAYRHGHTAAK